MKLLGLSGKAGHGKDTVANVLTNLYTEYGLVRRAFADSLKGDIGFLLTFGAWETEWWNAHMHGEDTVDFINSIKHHPEIRALLQAYGVAQRKGQPDYWIQRLFGWAEARGVRGVVIPDVRFRNEADAIRGRGGIIIKVNRPGYWNGLAPEAAAHSSETEMDTYESFAGYIHNDGGLDRLRAQCQGNYLELYLRRGAGVGAAG